MQITESNLAYDTAVQCSRSGRYGWQIMRGPF
jgi:hypothetical protein